tara:strand:+ start:54 stop:2231 length:2178 start_codon:yes stop_codon:yes gene_type:complete
MSRFPFTGSRISYALSSCLLASAPLASPGALAAPEQKLEEIVVTANYRDSDLLNTPASVTVITQETIRRRAAVHLQQILNTAPNVTWAAGSSRSRFIQVRGIGDLEQYYDPKYYPSIGIMLDNLELGDSANAGMLFDVSQVEVLRGPQGTRYGASAHAGMVNIRSNAPTREFEGELNGRVGNYDSYQLGLALSGPLSDTVAARVAAQQFRSDGYIENVALDRDDSADFDEATVRTRVQWTPSDVANYELGVLYFNADNGYDAWSLNNSRETFSDQPGEDTQETLAFTGSGQWLLASGHTLEAVISHIDTELGQSYDADWVSDALCVEFTCSGGNDTAQEIFARDRNRSVADVRLLGGAETLARGEGRYVLGLYANVSDEALDYDYPSVWYGDFGNNSDYDTERQAIYGEYEFAVTDRLSLTAGARVERFEDDYSDSNGFRSDSSENLLNAELSARYDLNEQTMLYASVARGAKPGGVNTTAGANQPFMSPQFQAYMADKLRFEDETLVNTEVGLKSVSQEGRLSANLALFRTTRSNAQLENWMWDGDAGLWVGYLDSASDATSYGAELETRFLASERIELFANLGWLETEVDSIETFDLDLNAFVTRDNREQAKSPQYQYNIGTVVTFSDALSARLEVEGQDSSFFGYYHNGELQGYDLLNASVNWVIGQVSLTFWGRNLTDEDYAVHGLYFGVDPRDDFGAWANQTYTQLGEPRTYGVEASYHF